jgi:glucose/arabinose dehydrogenase
MRLDEDCALPCCRAAPALLHACSWRYIKFDSAGKLLVTIGVPCNVCDVDDPKVGSGGKGKFRYGEAQRRTLNSKHLNSNP